MVDTKGWNGWEWTHGVALTALAHVRPSQPHTTLNRTGPHPPAQCFPVLMNAAYELFPIVLRLGLLA